MVATTASVKPEATEAGCKYIQIDEPLFARKPDQALSYGIKNLERKYWGKRLLTSLKDKDPEAHYYPITYEFVDKSRAQLGCYSITSKTFLKIGVYILEFGLVIRE